MFTLNITSEERKTLLDALKKGASQNETKAKFYAGRMDVSHLKAAAAIMRRLYTQLAAMTPDRR